MVSDEDALRQKHRLPRALRNSVANDAKLRASCPVYGTTFGGQARPGPRANKLNYVRRKEREREAKEKAKAKASGSEGGDEGQAGGSVRMRAKGRKSSSSSGTPPPAFARAATTPTTAPPALTDPTTPSDERVHTALVPQLVYYHSWSIYDPPTPAVPVDQHLPTAPAYTAIPDPTHYQPLAPMGTYEHHTVGAHNSCLQLRSQLPHATTVGPSSSPDATYAVDNAYPAYSPAAMPDPQTNNGSPSTGSSRSPLAVQAESRGVSVTPPPIHIASQLDPGLLTAQDSADHFNAAYQNFYADTLQEAHNRPITQAHHSESTAADNTLGGASTHGTTEQDFANAGPVSATQPESDQPVVWYAPPAAVAHVDRGRSYDIERGGNDGYDAQIQYPPLAPPATSTYEGDMHPSPPAPLSSYSELAQALQYPPRDFVDDCAPSSANGLGTASRPTASAEPDTPLYIHTSNGDVASTPRAQSSSPRRTRKTLPPAVYASLLRTMREYSRFDSARIAMETQLSQLIDYNLFGLDYGYVDTDDDELCEELELDRRVADANRLVEEWRRTGALRDNDGSIGDALVKVVSGRRTVEEILWRE